MLKDDELGQAPRDVLLRHIEELQKLLCRCGEAVEYMTFMWDGGWDLHDPGYPERKANDLLNDIIDAAGSHPSW